RQGHGFLDTSGSFTIIDVPGASNTSASGINGAGQIVGYFVYSISTGDHGFFDSGVSLIQVDVPAGSGTQSLGINSAGQIVGSFESSFSNSHGFLADPVKPFAGTPGKANCHGRSVSVLARQFGGLDAAASALGFPSVQALQDTIRAFCEG